MQHPTLPQQPASSCCAQRCRRSTAAPAAPSIKRLRHLRIVLRPMQPAAGPALCCELGPTCWSAAQMHYSPPETPKSPAGHQQLQHSKQLHALPLQASSAPVAATLGARQQRRRPLRDQQLEAGPPT